MIGKVKGVGKHNNSYAISVVTPNNNEYRYVYYPEQDMVSCNIGNGDVTDEVKQHVIGIVKSRYREDFE